jgi:hypothetical protein
MAKQIFSNNAETTIAAQCAIGSNTLVVAAGTGSFFRSPGTDEFELITLSRSPNDFEIVRCTSRSGDSLFIERGQEATIAKQWEIGEYASARVTRGTMEFLQAEMELLQGQINGLTTALNVVRGDWYDYGNIDNDTTINISTHNSYRIRLTGSIDISFTGGITGQATRLILVQDATGGRSVAFPNITRWVEGIVPSLTGTAGKVDIIGVMPAYTTTNEYLGISYALNL